jgi:hypothetical protein
VWTKAYERTEFEGRSDVTAQCYRSCEDVAVAVLQLIGSWLDHLCDRVRSFPWQSELVLVLGRLRSPQHQVVDFEVLPQIFLLWYLRRVCW